MATDSLFSGGPVGSAEGGLIYAVGDIHGCYQHLRVLLTKIVVDVQQRAAGRPVSLIFCGDYIDRGPNPREVVDALWWLKRHSPFDVRFLRGNHEQVLLDYLDDPAAAGDWMRFGGIATLQSYGVVPPEPHDDLIEHVRARDELLENMPAAHLTFFNNLELMVGIGDYAFVHAGVRPGVPLKAQSSNDLLWIQDEWAGQDRPAERIIVHGHTWTDKEPEIRRHRIGIDTGAYETGVLTAVRIEDQAIAFLSASTLEGRPDS